MFLSQAIIIFNMACPSHLCRFHFLQITLHVNSIHFDFYVLLLPGSSTTFYLRPGQCGSPPTQQTSARGIQEDLVVNN